MLVTIVLIRDMAVETATVKSAVVLLVKVKARSTVADMESAVLVIIIRAPLTAILTAIVNPGAVDLI